MNIQDESSSTMNLVDTDFDVHQPSKPSIISFISGSMSRKDSIKTFCFICLAVLTLLGLLIGLPIATIVFGSTINMTNCPIQPKLPIFLIVSGVASLTSIVFCIIIVCIKLNEVLYIFGVCLIYIEALLQLFKLSWAILGFVLVFIGMQSAQQTDTSLSTYCDKYIMHWLIAPVFCQFVISLLLNGLFFIVCWRNKY